MRGEWNWPLAWLATWLILWLDGKERGRALWRLLGLMVIAALTTGARLAESDASALGGWILLLAFLPALVVHGQVINTRVRGTIGRRSVILRFDSRSTRNVSLSAEAHRVIFVFRWIAGAFSYWYMLVGVETILAYGGIPAVH